MSSAESDDVRSSDRAADEPEAGPEVDAARMAKVSQAAKRINATLHDMMKRDADRAWNESGRLLDEWEEYGQGAILPWSDPRHPLHDITGPLPTFGKAEVTSRCRVWDFHSKCWKPQ